MGESGARARDLSRSSSNGPTTQVAAILTNCHVIPLSLEVRCVQWLRLMRKEHMKH